MVATKYNKGDEVFGLDHLDIVNGVHGVVKEVHLTTEMKPVYIVDFDGRGTYLMKENAITNDVNKLKNLGVLA